MSHLLPAVALLGGSLLATPSAHALQQEPEQTRTLPPALTRPALPSQSLRGPALWALLAKLAASCHATGQDVTACLAQSDKSLH